MKWKIDSVISYLARAAIISPDSIFVSYPKSECSIISSDFFLFFSELLMAAIISLDFTFSFSDLLEQLLSPISFPTFYSSNDLPNRTFSFPTF